MISHRQADFQNFLLQKRLEKEAATVEVKIETGYGMNGEEWRVVPLMVNLLAILTQEQNRGVVQMFNDNFKNKNFYTFAKAKEYINGYVAGIAERHGLQVDKTDKIGQHYKYVLGPKYGLGHKQ